MPVLTSDLSLRVTEDDGLCDGECVVKVTQCVKLPLLSLHGNKELFNSLQSQLITEGRRQTGTHTHRGEKMRDRHPHMAGEGIERQDRIKKKY